MQSQTLLATPRWNLSIARHRISQSGTSSLPTAVQPDCPASIHIPEVSGNGGSAAAIVGSSPIALAVPDPKETQMMLRAGPRRRSPEGTVATSPFATSSISQFGFAPAINLASRLIHMATGSKD